MKVLLTGASGFIGTCLATSLTDAGHDLVAMTRRPEDYTGPGRAVYGDTGDARSLQEAMAGREAAYYLVHNLDRSDGFDADADAAAAATFGLAAATAALGQIIYLGGLGAEGDDLSDHLASRQEVEGRLGQAGVPVTALRAALVIGKGSASFELLRQVVANLPVLVIPPKASATRVQPIALADVVRYLIAVLGLPAARNTVLEIGGAEVMTYADLLHRMAGHLGKHGRALRVPPMPDRITKLGVALATDVDPQLALTLLDSLGNDVIVTEHPITDLLPGGTQSLDEMIEAALADDHAPGVSSENA